ncbi:MAG: elongation factor 1-alpha C-terminal domain-related protein [Solirubrobacteraceae bacterium]
MQLVEAYAFEHAVIAPARNLADVRFLVQRVIRPMTDEHHDYRGYAGQVAGSVLRPGSPVTILPGGRSTTVASIDAHDGEVGRAFLAISIILRLADQVDISRGDMIVDQLGLNEIGRVCLRTSTSLMVDPYARNRTTGSFILIDEATNDTVAVGMIMGAR